MRFVLRRAYLDPKNVEMAFFMGVLQLCYLIWGFRSGFDTHTRTKEARLDESQKCYQDLRKWHFARCAKEVHEGKGSLPADV